jgi:CRP-like cAMP-binding protein
MPAAFPRVELSRMSRALFDPASFASVGGGALTFPDGGVIFLKGDLGERAFLVKKGKVEIRDAGRSLEIVEPGGLFGEMAIIDREPRSAAAVAIGPTELVAIDREGFDRLVRDMPGFAVTVMRLLSKRLRAVGAHRAADERLPVPPSNAA